MLLLSARCDRARPFAQVIDGIRGVLPATPVALCFTPAGLRIVTGPPPPAAAPTATGAAAAAIAPLTGAGRCRPSADDALAEDPLPPAGVAVFLAPSFFDAGYATTTLTPASSAAATVVVRVRLAHLGALLRRAAADDSLSLTASTDATIVSAAAAACETSGPLIATCGSGPAVASTLAVELASQCRSRVLRVTLPLGSGGKRAPSPPPPPRPLCGLLLGERVARLNTAPAAGTAWGRPLTRPTCGVAKLATGATTTTPPPCPPPRCCPCRAAVSTTVAAVGAPPPPVVARPTARPPPPPPPPPRPLPLSRAPPCGRLPPAGATAVVVSSTALRAALADTVPFADAVRLRVRGGDLGIAALGRVGTAVTWLRGTPLGCGGLRGDGDGGGGGGGGSGGNGDGALASGPTPPPTTKEGECPPAPPALGVYALRALCLVAGASPVAARVAVVLGGGGVLLAFGVGAGSKGAHGWVRFFVPEAVEEG
ncbi:hypothetical protein MMPV_002303 [Pyropia vietnamensis]